MVYNPDGPMAHDDEGFSMPYLCIPKSRLHVNYRLMMIDHEVFYCTTILLMTNLSGLTSYVQY